MSIATNLLPIISNLKKLKKIMNLSNYMKLKVISTKIIHAQKHTFTCTYLHRLHTCVHAHMNKGCSDFIIYAVVI